MNKHLVAWLLSIFALPLVLCVAAGLGSFGAETFFPPVAGIVAVGTWWLSRSLDQRARALLATPVPTKTYATLFWAFAVLSMPAVHTLQQLLPGVVGFDVNWPWITRRAVLLTGAAASMSLSLGFQHTSRAAMTSPWALGVVKEQFLQLVLLGLWVWFAWLMTLDQTMWVPMMVVGLILSIGVTIGSYVAREATWSPARRLARLTRIKTTDSREPDTMPSRFWPAQFLWMWRGHLFLGVSLGLLFLVLNEVAHLLANVRVDGIWVFALLFVGCADVTRALDVHTVRSMPISRLRQTALYLAYPATAFVPSLLMVPIGSAWYGWDLLHAMGIVLAAMSVHGLCSAAQIVTDETFFVLFEGVLFLGVVLLFMALPWPVGFYYVVTAIFGSVTLIAVYALLGSSSAYHRGKWDAAFTDRVR